MDENDQSSKYLVIPAIFECIKDHAQDDVCIKKRKRNNSVHEVANDGNDTDDDMDAETECNPGMGIQHKPAQSSSVIAKQSKPMRSSKRSKKNNTPNYYVLHLLVNTDAEIYHLIRTTRQTQLPPEITNNENIVSLGTWMFMTNFSSASGMFMFIKAALVSELYKTYGPGSVTFTGNRDFSVSSRKINKDTLKKIIGEIVTRLPDYRVYE